MAVDSRYVQHVKDVAEVVVTMRGRRVARLVPVDEVEPPGPCPSSSQSNGADRRLRYVGLIS